MQQRFALNWLNHISCYVWTVNANERKLFFSRKRLDFCLESHLLQEVLVEDHFRSVKLKLKNKLFSTKNPDTRRTLYLLDFKTKKQSPFKFKKSKLNSFEILFHPSPLLADTLLCNIAVKSGLKEETKHFLNVWDIPHNLTLRTKRLIRSSWQNIVVSISKRRQKIERKKKF